MDRIDFVITWLDNTDPVWQKDFYYYLPENRSIYDLRNIRFRNWDNLRYWFRGVEKYAPWVNKIHLVTCGQIPDWLNLSAPKLNFVKHSDFIPHEYLPTFSSCPIALNLHHIENLSEHFVLFDDDMFVVNKVEPKHFFRNGLPCDKAAFDALSPGDIFTHLTVNNLFVINSSFKKHQMLRKHLWKWLSLRAGIKLLCTIFLLPWSHFTGFYDPHLPQVFLKSTFEDIWEKHEEVLLRTTATKFRGITDVSSWLFRYWQLAKGNFVPMNIQKYGAYFKISDNSLDKIVQTIEHQKKSVICLNDGEVSSFEEAKNKINAAFQKILPEKSSFEK